MNMKLDFTEPKLAAWKASLENSGCTINKITPLSVQTKGNGDLLFAYISADVTAPEGYPLLPIIFIRGDAVLVVPEIINSDTGEIRYLMVEQRRIASGELHLEFPAGMLDREIENPAAVAVKELFEETGLPMDESKLTPLTEAPLFSSPGASDEKIWFFGTSITLSDEEFKSLHGRIQGEKHENEHITTVLADRETFFKQNNSAQALLGLTLFEQQKS